jgi:enoyl-CoA hydratase/carnithine racemase
VLRNPRLSRTKFNGRDALRSELVDETAENVEGTLAAAVKKAKELAARKWERGVYKSLKVGSFVPCKARLYLHSA